MPARSLPQRTPLKTEGRSQAQVEAQREGDGLLA